MSKTPKAAANLEVERAVLTALMSGIDASPTDNLSAREFFFPFHRRVYSAIRVSLEKKEPISELALIETMKLDAQETAELKQTIDGLLLVRRDREELAANVGVVRRLAKERDVRFACEEAARSNGDIESHLINLRLAMESYESSLRPAGRLDWPEFHKISELAAGEPESIIDGYVEEGLSFLGAKSGVIKTWLGISEGKALRTGEQLLDTFPVPKERNVLYLIPEMTERRFRSRCVRLRVDIDDPGFRVRTMSDGAPLPLNDPALCRYVETSQPVVYLDTAIRFGAGTEENSAGEVSHGLVNATYQLIKLGAPAVRALHHRAKEASDDELTLENVLRGSGDFGAGAVCVWGAAHITAARAGQFETFDSIGRQKPKGEARKKLEREYLRESKRLGRVYCELVKPGDREPRLWDFRIQLRPGIDDNGKIEMLTALPLPPPSLDDFLANNPDASLDRLAQAVGVSKATAWRRAQESGWRFDEETKLWRK